MKLRVNNPASGNRHRRYEFCWKFLEFETIIGDLKKDAMAGGIMTLPNHIIIFYMEYWYLIDSKLLRN